jgi:hypothetical protein
MSAWLVFLKERCYYYLEKQELDMSKKARNIGKMSH